MFPPSERLFLKGVAPICFARNYSERRSCVRVEAKKLLGGSQIMPGELVRDDWYDYRAFAMVARHGSFGTAARALHMTRHTLTFHITGLEHRLGFQLLNRLPQGVELTRDG